MGCSDGCGLEKEEYYTLSPSGGIMRISDSVVRKQKARHTRDLPLHSCAIGGRRLTTTRGSFRASAFVGYVHNTTHTSFAQIQTKHHGLDSNYGYIRTVDECELHCLVPGVSIHIRECGWTGFSLDIRHKTILEAPRLVDLAPVPIRP